LGKKKKEKTPGFLQWGGKYTKQKTVDSAPAVAREKKKRAFGGGKVLERGRGVPEKKTVGGHSGKKNKGGKGGTRPKKSRAQMKKGTPSTANLFWVGKKGERKLRKESDFLGWWQKGGPPLCDE